MFSNVNILKTKNLPKTYVKVIKIYDVFSYIDLFYFSSKNNQFNKSWNSVGETEWISINISAFHLWNNPIHYLLLGFMTPLLFCSCIVSLAQILALHNTNFCIMSCIIMHFSNQKLPILSKWGRNFDMP